MAMHSRSATAAEIFREATSRPARKLRLVNIFVHASATGFDTSKVCTR
jgi:hypothetical protein